jgi:serine/threonine protein kinase
MRAAQLALNKLPKRARHVLEHVLINAGSIETIAKRNMIGRERAEDWIDDARKRFASLLAVELERAQVAKDRIPKDPEAVAEQALRLAMPTEMSSREDERVDTIIGDYTLIEKLGGGGMGIVYRAEHARLGRAAVKILREEYAKDPNIVERLNREARTARMVRNPGVVTIYECGRDGDVAFIAMELLEGSSLGTRLRDRGKLAIADAVRIARQTANVLVAVHEEGIAHRDLKPDNIFLVADAEVRGGERVKVLDFGIAKLRARGANDPELTHANDVIGSPSYMAPEQCEASRNVTVSADVYSLGCTIVHLVAGRPPFTGSRERVQAAQLLEQPPALRTLAPDAPPSLDALVTRCLAKDPTKRPSMKEVVERLRAIEDELSSQVTVVATPTHVTTPADDVADTTLKSSAGSVVSRVRRSSLAISLLTLAAVAGVIVWWRWPREAPEQPIVAPIAKQPPPIDTPPVHTPTRAELLEAANPFSITVHTPAGDVKLQAHQVTHREYAGDANASEEPQGSLAYEEAAAFCALLKARLPSSEEWALAGRRGWGIPDEHGQPGPLQEWTSTTMSQNGVVALVTVRGGHSRMTPVQQNAAATATLQKETIAIAGSNAPRTRVSNPLIGFRCARIIDGR